MHPTFFRLPNESHQAEQLYTTQFIFNFAMFTHFPLVNSSITSFLQLSLYF